MRHVERMSLEEIAASVGIPVGTVKSRMFRALEQLQQILESLLPEDAR
jgi:DNA-directed RNA polymerase specialized sigma24 family protein